MKPRLLHRGGMPTPGLVLAQNVGPLAKGLVLSQEQIEQLRELAWSELHLVELEPGDLHEDVAGERLAAASAGDGVGVQPLASGSWPLAAQRRGLLEIEAAQLARVNQIDDLVVVTLPQGQVVVDREVVGRAKIVPFVAREENVRRAEAIATESSGLLRVRPFVLTRVAAVVQENVDDAGLKSLGEKLAFFGAALVSVTRIGTGEMRLEGAQLVIMAGSKVMDPLDPAIQALTRAGARVEKLGVPLHPGILLWLAYLDQVPVIGAPSCAIFSRPTAFDLLLPRLLAGRRPSRAELAELGAGGLLTKEMAFRFPPYRPGGVRGEI
ncbi:MAG: hypothetical protein E6J78_20265 [Deltaproteobacteria bacterium]|nr:MAG: hypothetical protein E6J78_20265 [Deltaproteobacteria bacterium]